jgi:RNA polymerase sigma-70 factor, ECF subfamily
MAGPDEILAAIGAERLAALCDAAAAAWPDVVVDPQALIRAIGERLAGGDPPAVGDPLAVELHLALACADGDPVAIGHFERRYLDVVAPALAHMKLPAATVDDVRAAVRDKLLLADGDRRARILDYAGHGRLRGLVQVSAVRTAISVLRHADREILVAGDDVAAQLASPDHDAELALIKEQYRAAFAAAFAESARDLDRRDRNLLRLHYLGGVTLEQLAAMYGVHRATVVRWMAAARQALLGGTRQRMRDRLAADELDHVMALIHSRIDVSVRRLLASIETTP